MNKSFPYISVVLLIQYLLFSIVLGSCKGHDESSSDNAAGIDSTSIATPASGKLYGQVPDTFIPEHGKIGRNQLISDLFLSKGFSYQQIEQMLSNSTGSFDPRKVRFGSSYTFFWSSDTANKPSYMIYDHDNTLSHIFRFDSVFGVSDYQHETISEIRTIKGTIETSLWESMIASEANPMLAVELSEIYAWTIDFFGLQKGDAFRVIYEEAYTGGKSVGITAIYGALFTHAGRDILAIPFMQNGNASFYDDEGNSLRKAFLKAPLRFSRISSGYSSGRLHPILKIVRPHHGIDYAAAIGTPVVSIGDGRVTSTAYESGAGRIVRIKHNSVYSTAYLHLSSFAKGIAAGVYVKQGDVIGYVGSSGLSTGPHLDFRFYKNGSPINPLLVESPPVEPVSEENQGRYKIVKDVVSSVLRNF
jgi:murein DD-endopeptidase MepM/ murein hydrolase activator NlpD